MKEFTEEEKVLYAENQMLLICPDCHERLIPESGCFICRWCGYTWCHQ